MRDAPQESRRWWHCMVSLCCLRMTKCFAQTPSVSRGGLSESTPERIGRSRHSLVTTVGDNQLRWRTRRKGGEPVGSCTHLSRLKGGGFAIKASGSKLVVAAGFEPALAAFSTPCLFQLGYATVGEMAPVVGLAPTRI